MLIGATIAGREKGEVNPTTKLSRAIQGNKGILLTETNYACPESWSRARVTRFAQVKPSFNAEEGAVKLKSLSLKAGFHLCESGRANRAVRSE